MNKVSFVKIKNSAHQETSQRNQKAEPQTGRNICRTYNCQKKLVSRTYKRTSMNKEKMVQLENGCKTDNRYSVKKDTKMVI